MKRFFYITGLPRSRTAWLSRLFTFGNVACLHDGIRHTDLVQRMHRLPQTAVGNSDSGLLLWESWREMPEGKWLIVKRNPDECLRSMLSMDQYGGWVPRPTQEGASRILAASMDEMKRLEAEKDCRVISFRDLDNESELCEAWTHLIGNEQPWNPIHFEEMRHFRVNVIPSTYEV